MTKDEFIEYFKGRLAEAENDIARSAWADGYRDGKIAALEHVLQMADFLREEVEA